MLGSWTSIHHRQRGFTLIEMSIVLVIIGLIIGGILKGQEIIESSRQKNVITQLDSVKASINTFADKFNALPGDYFLASSRINSTVADGDGDGIIGANSINGVGNAGENLEFWDHLAAAELVSGTTLNGGGGGFGDGDSLPATAVPGTGMTVSYGEHTPGSNNRSTHWVRIHKVASTADVDDGTDIGAFSGKRMFEIDLKVDDGQPYLGTARVIGGDGTNCGSAAYSSLINIQSCVPYFDLVQ